MNLKILRSLYGSVLSVLHALPYAWEFSLLTMEVQTPVCRCFTPCLVRIPECATFLFATQGSPAAFAAGFRHAHKGDVFVTMDADLQNDPADIPAMLDAYVQGVDMVVGWPDARIQWSSAMPHVSPTGYATQ